MPRQQQIIAVVIKQYGTGLYRTCVSLGKGNMTYLGTYRDERSASDKIGQFWQAWDEGEIRQPEDLSRLIAEGGEGSPTTGSSAESSSSNSTAESPGPPRAA
jgi:hypothetical protein